MDDQERLRPISGRSGHPSYENSYELSAFAAAARNSPHQRSIVTERSGTEFSALVIPSTPYHVLCRQNRLHALSSIGLQPRMKHHSSRWPSEGYWDGVGYSEFCHSTSYFRILDASSCSNLWQTNWGQESQNDRVVGEWTATMGYTIDEKPLLGKLKGRQGVWLCAGLNGDGTVGFYCVLFS